MNDNDNTIVSDFREIVRKHPFKFPTVSQFTDEMWESPFMQLYGEEGYKLENGEEILTVNGSSMGQAVWNLICSKRDLSLWTRGIKPHRHWRVTDAKRYFGIKGNRDKLLSQITLIHDVIVKGEK
jgi:hypothetical protein